MHSTHVFGIALLAPLLFLELGCRDEPKVQPDAAVKPPPTPVGMASAATFTATTNALEVLATFRRPRELVLADGQLVVADTPLEAWNPDAGMDLMSLLVAPGAAPKPIYPAQRGAQGLSFAGGRLTWIVAPKSDDKTKTAHITSAKVGSPPKSVGKTYALDETTTVSDGTDVFTFGVVGDPSSLASEILKVDASGKTKQVAKTGPRPVRTALAVNATHVFWVQDDAIVRVPKAGGEPTPVTKLGKSKIKGLVADEASVYWADFGTADPTWSGRVKRASVSDGKTDTLSDAPAPSSIAIDAESVYWTSGQDAGGRVLSQKKSGGPTFVLATGLRGPRAIAVDQKHVYWLNNGDGKACRTEKVPRPKL